MKNWKEILDTILSSEKMVEMKGKLDVERANFNILPEKKNMFNAFMLCPFDKLKVVILGQDPYPDPVHPHGLAFSSMSKQTPASLSNIFKEIHDELYPNEDIDECFKSNNLTSWAQQGILLMNTCLTVRAGEAGSHKDLGWDYFTNEIMEELNKYPTPLVFMLWGAHAKKYAGKITNPDHLVLQSAHPSPLSAHNGFTGNMHFRTASVFIRKEFYRNLIISINNSVDRDRLKRGTDRFFEEKGIVVQEGNIMHIYNVMFDDIGLFFDELIPELKSQHEINWRT